jgi:uncharacterized integral membrane protein
MILECESVTGKWSGFINELTKEMIVYYQQMHLMLILFNLKLLLLLLLLLFINCN